MESESSIYNRACQLSKYENDPIEEPYKSKYTAKELFEEVKKILLNKLESTDAADTNFLQAQLAAVFTQVGTINLDTDEFSEAQGHFEKAINICNDVKLSHLMIYPAILSRNSLAVLWASRDEQEKSLAYLEKAKNLYIRYKTENELQAPKTLDSIFDSVTQVDEVGWDALEKLYTLTLYYLAQVMEKLGRSEESAELCMSTLQRQLSLNDYEALTWASNAANLSHFFEVKFKFRISRRLLAVSWAMVQSVNKEEYCKTSTSNDKYSKTVAIISKQWGTYCVSLLQESYDTLEETQTRLDETEANYLEQVNFSNLEYIQHEEGISCMLAKSVNDATEIFKAGLRWLNDTLTYFTLLEHASTHTEITQQISTMYKLLAEFDPAPDRQSKMHKRRVILLSDIVTELNPQYYLNVCHQLNYEIAEAYLAMVDCKFKIVGRKKPTVQQTEKINTLISHGINFFGKVLDSFKLDENGVPILSEGYIRPGLVAYFRIARLWSKYVRNSKQEQINCLQKSVENYKKVIKYCHSHPESRSCIEEELEICHTMAQLLPLKIRKIMNA